MFQTTNLHQLQEWIHAEKLREIWRDEDDEIFTGNSNCDKCNWLSQKPNKF